VSEENSSSALGDLVRSGSPFGPPLAGLPFRDGTHSNQVTQSPVVLGALPHTLTKEEQG